MLRTRAISRSNMKSTAKMLCLIIRNRASGHTGYEQSVAPTIFALGHERFEPLHRGIALRRDTCLLDQIEHLTEANGIDRQQQQIREKSRNVSGERAKGDEECIAGHVSDAQRWAARN